MTTLISADAHAAATTPAQAQAATRNAAVREALALIHAGDKARALAVLQVSVGTQAWFEGLSA